MLINIMHELNKKNLPISSSFVLPSIIILEVIKHEKLEKSIIEKQQTGSRTGREEIFEREHR